MDGPPGAPASVPAHQVTFAEFLARLVQCAKVYGELILVKTADARVNRHLRNLRMIKAVQRSWWNALQAATEGRWQVARPTGSPTRGSVVLLIDGRAQGEIHFEAQALVWRDAAGAAYRAALPEPTVRELQEVAAGW